MHRNPTPLIYLVCGLASCTPGSAPNLEPGLQFGAARETPARPALSSKAGMAPLAAAPPASPEQSQGGSAAVTSAIDPAADAQPPRRDPFGSHTAILSATIALVENPSLRLPDIKLRVRAPDGPFGELTRRGLARHVRDGALLVRLSDNYPISHDAAAARYRACSYVVDCDSPAVKSLGDGVLSAKPTLSDLVSLVGRRISVKSLSRGFDVASEVATSGEGDCSEHAVLLAALARHHRLAARVVFGIAVLVFDGRPPMLVGHAWTEIHDGKVWRLADAALDGLEYQKVPGLSRLHYLPISLLEHEGVGFQAKLLGVPNAFSIVSVEAGY